MPDLGQVVQATPRTSVRRAVGLPGSAAARLYSVALPVPESEIPVADPATHTMGAAVDTYVAQRLPGSLLDQAMASGMPVEVHGIFPYHLPRVIQRAVRMTGAAFSGTGKIHNVIRPAWYIAPGAEGSGWRLVAAVPPGRDYVLHYASMTRHYLRLAGAGPGALAAVVRYPAAERHAATWTALGDFVRPGDRILFGYVDQLVPLLTARGAEPAGHTASAFYTATRLSFASGAKVCAIGVRFSFWGCISGRLAAACREREASEIVYAGKLGTLSAPGDVYGRLFVPSAYVQAQCAAEVRTRVLEPQEAPRNGLLERYPELASGPHISVATVLEEGDALHACAAALGASTVDNEIAQMAAALVRPAGEPGTAFSAIHFATDYLAAPGDADGACEFNLTNNRVERARRKRAKMLRSIAEILSDYYAN